MHGLSSAVGIFYHQVSYPITGMNEILNISKNIYPVAGLESGSLGSLRLFPHSNFHLLTRCFVGENVGIIDGERIHSLLSQWLSSPVFYMALQIDPTIFV